MDVFNLWEKNYYLKVGNRMKLIIVWKFIIFDNFCIFRWVIYFNVNDRLIWFWLNV